VGVVGVSVERVGTGVVGASLGAPVAAGGKGAGVGSAVGNCVASVRGAWVESVTASVSGAAVDATSCLTIASSSGVIGAGVVTKNVAGSIGGSTVTLAATALTIVVGIEPVEASSTTRADTC
jgi:hypothetical protein